jgi:hypothetical protein
MMRAVLVALALVSLPAAAVYKWVDEKGVTHYTEEPPADGKATRIETRTVGPGGTTGATDDWKQKELERRKERLDRDHAEDYAKRKSEHDAAVRANRCLESRRRLATLERARPVYQINERGEKVYLEDQDRPRQVEQARAQVEKSCDGP